MQWHPASRISITVTNHKTMVSPSRPIEHKGGPINGVGLIVPTEEYKYILACMLDESQFKMYYRLKYKKKTVKFLENNWCESLDDVEDSSFST